MLNVISLNTTINNQRIAEWIKKNKQTQDTATCYSIRNTLDSETFIESN